MTRGWKADRENRQAERARPLPGRGLPPGRREPRLDPCNGHKRARGGRGSPTTGFTGQWKARLDDGPVCVSKRLGSSVRARRGSLRAQSHSCAPRPRRTRKALRCQRDEKEAAGLGQPLGSSEAPGALARNLPREVCRGSRFSSSEARQVPAGRRLAAAAFSARALRRSRPGRQALAVTPSAAAAAGLSRRESTRDMEGDGN